MIALCTHAIDAIQDYGHSDWLLRSGFTVSPSANLDLLHVGAATVDLCTA